MLNINFDSYAGESFYNDKMQPVVDELKERGKLKKGVLPLADKDK